MTTTVRILGSRAREQVPGTSITLLAPGFRGSLTQEAVSAHESGAVPELPFADAATGADVMLAAQLSMSLEARPPDGGPELRSRSAVAAYPRLIVPRRNGVAYALLQTDAAGFSEFVMPLTHDGDEAVFPLTVARAGATRRTLRVFMWAAPPVQGPGTQAVMSRWERQRRPHRLLQLTAQGSWELPDAGMLARGPCLLLLHGCFATPHSAFGPWLAGESFAAIYSRYEGRCLAFAHPTLSVAIEENVQFLAASLPPIPALDIVAHGRGGLFARAVAADGRVAVRRAVLVGTPNHGTPFASGANFKRFLDGHVAWLARAPGDIAIPILEGTLSLARCVALGLPTTLPGVEPLLPDSSLLIALATPRDSSTQWYTVGARFTSTDAESAGLEEVPNDLVVPSESCHLPTAQLTDGLRLAGGGIHHHNYFSDEHVLARLDAWLA
jgi:hypothetical protein